MSFPSHVKEEVLVACGRHCAICHKFCGLKIELHHILPHGDGGQDTFDNCISLCFDCHSEMSSYDHRHPKGTKYAVNELRQHRDNWYIKVKQASAIPNLPEHLELDRAVYKRILEILPWNGSINFIRTNNFAGFSFRLKHLEDLDKLGWECENPAFEFVDADLEGLRVELIENLEQFMSLIGIETFPMQNPEFNSVPAEWELEQPERFWKVVKGLHDSASKVAETYDALVKMGRRKLGVS